MGSKQVGGQHTCSRQKSSFVLACLSLSASRAQLGRLHQGHGCTSYLLASVTILAPVKYDVAPGVAMLAIWHWLDLWYFMEEKLTIYEVSWVRPWIAWTWHRSKSSTMICIRLTQSNPESLSSSFFLPTAANMLGLQYVTYIHIYLATI